MTTTETETVTLKDGRTVHLSSTGASLWATVPDEPAHLTMPLAWRDSRAIFETLQSHERENTVLKRLIVLMMAATEEADWPAMMKQLYTDACSMVEHGDHLEDGYLFDPATLPES